ncbi:hypothetical protein BR93DRAFT_760645 [Coniochaeta sp. PMI_546]|nr:hypothetical protein BR93DRAFT_760645 [Coniochaeta sp. PMI_546]
MISVYVRHAQLQFGVFYGASLAPGILISQGQISSPLEPLRAANRAPGTIWTWSVRTPTSLSQDRKLPERSPGDAASQLPRTWCGNFPRQLGLKWYNPSPTVR